MTTGKQNTNRDGKYFVAFLVLLAALPLPLGSNRAWAWSMMEIASFLILAAWLVAHIRNPFEIPQTIKTARIPVILLFAWIVYTLLQATLLPSGIVQFLSEASYNLARYATDNQPTTFSTLSIEKSATLAEFLKSCSYFSIFMLSMLLINSRDRLLLTAKILVFVGVAEALYGLMNTLSGIEYIWWFPKTAYTGNVTGTFINRNHMAGHLELVIPLAIGLLLARRTHAPDKRGSLKHAVYNLASLMLDKRGRLMVYTLIMFAALFLTASRAGNASLFASLVAVVVIALLFRGKKSEEARYAPMIIAMALIAAVWLGLGKLPGRYSQTQTQAQARLYAWQNTMVMIGDYTLTGSGAGTFQYLFPMYETGSLSQVYDHAHNDYLELLEEQGIIGFALAAFAIVSIWFTIAKAFIRRRNVYFRAMLFGSLAGMTSLLLHAMVDFNFHIPANTAYFYVVMGMGLAAATIKHRGNRSPGHADGQARAG